MRLFKGLFSGKYFAKVKNDAGERIETLRFSVPALRVGVLDYAPGQLQTTAPELQNKTINLYYPPEAVNEKEFLKTLENAPIVLGGHGKTTNELDKDIDGWPRSVRFDEGEQAAIVDGVVKGKRGAEYIRQNFNTPEFGASAFLDIQIEPKEGTTPDGKMFNAVATKLRATHLALAPQVRDPENKIELVNAVTINSRGVMNTKTEEKRDMEISKEELVALVSNTMKEVLAKNAEGEELSDMKSAITKIEEGMATLQKAIGEESAERVDGAGNCDNCGAKMKNAEEKDDKEKKDEEGKDDSTLENALPSQKLVAAFATAYNTEFGHKTPSFKTLAALAGIKEEDPSARIAAVNAKFVEIEKSTPAMNTTIQTGTESIFGGKF